MLNKGNPFADRSEGLWKTLGIWVDAINEKKIDINKTQFYLVTNKQIPDGLAKRLGKIEKSEKEIAHCIEELKEIGKSPSESIASFANVVMLCEDDTLRELIRRIFLADAKTCNGKNHGLEIAACLNLSVDSPVEDIINDLLGWMHTKVTRSWEANEPAWITKREFTFCFIKTMSRYSNKIFREKTKRDLVPILDIDKEKHLGKKFVNQLIIISIDDDEIIDAITDYLCSQHELTRFADEGSITDKDVEAFEDRLKDRWMNIYRDFERRKMQENDEKAIGKAILYKTLDYRELLAGQQTEEYFLTRGTYHKLADNLMIGWHPDYKKELNQMGFK